MFNVGNKLTVPTILAAEFTSTCLNLIFNALNIYLLKCKQNIAANTVYYNLVKQNTS